MEKTSLEKVVGLLLLEAVTFSGILNILINKSSLTENSFHFSSFTTYQVCNYLKLPAPMR